MAEAARPQGCNSALESARVLAETLDKVGLERLEQLPAAYNAARIRDAHAVQDIDYSATVRPLPHASLARNSSGTPWCSLSCLRTRAVRTAHRKGQRHRTDGFVTPFCARP